MPDSLACLRTHLGAEDTVGLGPVQQRIQIRDRLHELNAVLLLGQALVHLEDGHHLLVVPEVLGRGLALDLPVHGVLEENGGQDTLPGEGGAGHDAGPHLMHQVEHLLIVGPGVLLDAVQAQRLRGTAATLVQRGDEAHGAGHLLELFVEIAHGMPLASCSADPEHIMGHLGPGLQGRMGETACRSDLLVAKSIATRGGACRRKRLRAGQAVHRPGITGSVAPGAMLGGSLVRPLPARSCCL